MRMYIHIHIRVYSLTPPLNIRDISGSAHSSFLSVPTRHKHCCHRTQRRVGIIHNVLGSYQSIGPLIHVYKQHRKVITTTVRNYLCLCHNALVNFNSRKFIIHTYIHTYIRTYTASLLDGIHCYTYVRMYIRPMHIRT